MTGGMPECQEQATFYRHAVVSQYPTGKSSREHWSCQNPQVLQSHAEWHNICM